MSDILQDNFELAVRIDRLKHQPEIVVAIADTWEFMTGKEMPADTVLEAGRRASAAEYSSIPVWSERLFYEATASQRLSAIGRIMIHDPRDMRGDPGVLLDAESELHLPEPDPMLTELVKMLGDSILDNAYLALGSKVQEVVDEINQARESGIEEIELINKILQEFDKLRGIVKESEDGQEEVKPKQNIFKDENGRIVNHILKLSPYYVEKLKDDVIDPTCLGFSIILASYLIKCGIKPEDLNHIGVVTPRSWPYSAALHELAQGIDDYASRNFVEYPDLLKGMIRRRAESARKLSLDWDPHSALITRLENNHMLNDAYQQTNVYLPRQTAKYQVETIKRLIELQPGLEVTYTPDNELSIDEWVNNLISAYRELLSFGLPSRERWEWALHYAREGLELEPLLELMHSIFHGQNINFYSLLMSSGLSTAELRTKDFGFSDDTSLEEIISAYRKHALLRAKQMTYESLARQVFWLDKYSPESVRKSLEMCDDEEYFQRRVDDLVLWPHRIMLMVLQKMCSDVDNIKSDLPHLAIEVGDISHRVGAAALLDVSYGLGQPLPLSFWATQTSSQLPWLYFQQAEMYETSSDVDKEISDKLKRTLQVLNWRYRQIVGII